MCSIIKAVKYPAEGLPIKLIAPVGGVGIDDEYPERRLSAAAQLE